MKGGIMTKLDFRKIHPAEDQRRHLQRATWQGEGPAGVHARREAERRSVSESGRQWAWRTEGILRKSCIESTKVGFDFLPVLGHFYLSISD